MPFKTPIVVMVSFALFGVDHLMGKSSYPMAKLGCEEHP